MLNNLMQVKSYHNLTFQERNHVIMQISKPSTFFIAFYNNLPYARTQIECFNKLNDLHFDIWGDYMYSSYHSFITVYKRHITTIKK